MARTTTQLTGDTGEFLVAAELARLNWTTALTMGNAVRSDLFSRHLETGVLVSIQVKTRARGTFLTGKNSETLPGAWQDPTLEREWFVLVSLGDDGDRTKDRFFVVPRLHLASYVFVGHRAWLAGEGRGGRVRKDSSMRAVHPEDMLGYEERWDLLTEPANQAPWLLPNWWWEIAASYLESATTGFEMPPREQGTTP